MFFPASAIGVAASMRVLDIAGTAMTGAVAGATTVKTTSARDRSILLAAAMLLREGTRAPPSLEESSVSLLLNGI